MVETVTVVEAACADPLSDRPRQTPPAPAATATAAAIESVRVLRWRPVLWRTGVVPFRGRQGKRNGPEGPPRPASDSWSPPLPERVAVVRTKAIEIFAPGRPTHTD
ncbi:hypothetical protein SAV14893_060150 [Streptomyces avermitilis]|uniref:Uncharacterized protein n=1 Tax=Streptomyces avermitilis TaxID=33903 RepID=A0A4D4M457_STRAX|nr:hypothetical protein SAVMC3_72500 [Streptomyces avermitilis]GDY66622.1 hypothetical protein SAV14893_060150 [Streptomyces avermitilis]GDY73134.1 hypothetical protein SAV31267_026190 [Streptomyces avermitilis]GDY82240.1 hypothetical protein SAVCW2_14390 [Streptomyces avermitilis]